MSDSHRAQVSRELFLAAFGAQFGRLESWVADRLVSLLEGESVRRGETLFSAGDPPDFFYFMRQGRIHLSRDGTRPWTLSGRHVFGIVDGLLDRPRTRTAVAGEDTPLMKIRIDAWLELLDDSFELARASVVELARHVAALEERRDLLEAAGGNVLMRAPLAIANLPAGRLNVIERLALLMDVPLLRGAGVQPLSDLAVASQEVHFDRGEVLLARGVPPDRVLVVVEGEVEASREAPDVTRTSGVGQIVGGTAAFGDAALAWQAKGTRRGRSIAFRLEDWFDLMEEHFDMVRSALAALSLQREALIDELGV